MRAEAAPSGHPVLQVDGLSKRYGEVVAVDHVSLQVEQGETFGIVGPNGAGKTTTLEIIEGLRTPDSGRISLLGVDALRQRRAAQQRIGVQLQAQALWPDLTVDETLRLFGSLFRKAVPRQSLLDRFSLNDKRSSQVKNLSGGQKQRLSVATALVNDPEVVFLDEPTTGLDPQARRDFWDLIREMGREGKTVVVTTHYMEEAEALCDRVAIMDYGRIIALDTPRQLVRSLDFDSTVECVLRGSFEQRDLLGLPAVRNVREEDGTAVLNTSDVPSTLTGLMRLGAEAGLEVQSLHVRTATLDDVFISLTGRRLRE
ncbi:MAG: ABC transporter ATP-binding protein [Chloroflexota bacterium]|nr:ABC transporter ATP-binding protein [Chloroflexota bacterium]